MGAVQMIVRPGRYPGIGGSAVRFLAGENPFVAERGAPRAGVATGGGAARSGAPHGGVAAAPLNKKRPGLN